MKHNRSELKKRKNVEENNNQENRPKSWKSPFTEVWKNKKQDINPSVYWKNRKKLWKWNMNDDHQNKNDG